MGSFANRAIRTGGAIYAANLTTMMIAAAVRGRSPWSGINAFGSAFGIGGRRSPDGFDGRSTPLSLVANFGHLMAWGAAYEGVLELADRRGSWATDVADALVGYAFDRFVLPRRLIRNARRSLGAGGLVALYASLALATAWSRSVRRFSRRRRSAPWRRTAPSPG